MVGLLLVGQPVIGADAQLSQKREECLMSTKPQASATRNTQARSSLALGVAALVLALLGLAPGILSYLTCVGAVAALLAVVAGVRGLRAARESGGQDRAMAIAGMVAAGLGLLVFIIITVVPALTTLLWVQSL